MIVQTLEISEKERTVAEHRYSRLQRNRVVIIASIAIACLISFCFDMATGPSSLPVKDVLLTVLSSSSVDEATRVIIWNIRMPYAVMALLVGMSLSIAGAEMQTVLNNPLASPFTLGVSAAATLGAALAIVLGITLPGISSEWIVSLNAFLFAFGSVLLLQLLARWKNADAGVLVLFGIALVFTFNALVALIHYVASPEALQQVVFWSMGSLARSNWEKIQLLVLVMMAVIPFTIRSHWKMTALRLGEEKAMGLGINVKRLRFASLFRISLLAASSVAFVGTIGFIGLVGPHIARMLVGEDHRYWFPASMMTGALLMSLASIASKLLVPGTLLPVGIVTALVGVPVFISLILQRTNR